MKDMSNQEGIIRTIPLLIVVAAVGIISFLLISSTAPTSGLFGLLNPKPSSHAATLATSNDWPQIQHDANHTGSTVNAVAPPYSVAWAWFDKTHIVNNFVSAAGKSLNDGFETGYIQKVVFADQVQPIVVNGIVYFGAMNGTMYAVDALSGANKWDFTAGGAIMTTAAYDNGSIIFGSMDGKVYALDALTGTLKWSQSTGAGIMGAPVVALNPKTGADAVYVGSKDGVFYAFDAAGGNPLWNYSTRDPASTGSPLNKDQIITPAAVSEDGLKVFFGAENMYFYGLNAADGTEAWVPFKVQGGTFLGGWPVVKGNRVIVRTTNIQGSDPGQGDVDNLLSTLPSTASAQLVQSTVNNYLNQNPSYKTMYVLDINTGREPYQVGMGMFMPWGFAQIPPVIDTQGRILTYYKTLHPTFLLDSPGACFGSKFCPDIASFDPNNGFLTSLPSNSTSKTATETDNIFTLTTGGDYLYLQNYFRGAKAVRLSTGDATVMTFPIACWDGGMNRYGNPPPIIYYGNDSQCNNVTNNPEPPSIYGNPFSIGSGIAIASSNGQTLLYINDSHWGKAIVALKGTTVVP